MPNWILIFGMFAVTYFPRMIPFVFLSDRPLPPFLRRFLLFIPFTALGALIMPGAFQATPGQPLAALGGVLAAGICAWFGGGLVTSVLAAVGTTLVCLYFLPI